jgi:hypothetical protein
MILTGSIVAARHLMLYRRRTRIKFVLPRLPRRPVSAKQSGDLRPLPSSFSFQNFSFYFPPPGVASPHHPLSGKLETWIGYE